MDNRDDVPTVRIPINDLDGPAADQSSNVGTDVAGGIQTAATGQVTAEIESSEGETNSSLTFSDIFIFSLCALGAFVLGIILSVIYIVICAVVIPSLLFIIFIANCVQSYQSDEAGNGHLYRFRTAIAFLTTKLLILLILPLLVYLAIFAIVPPLKHLQICGIDIYKWLAVFIGICVFCFVWSYLSYWVEKSAVSDHLEGCRESFAAGVRWLLIVTFELLVLLIVPSWKDSSIYGVHTWIWCLVFLIILICHNVISVLIHLIVLRLISFYKHVDQKPDSKRGIPSLWKFMRNTSLHGPRGAYHFSSKNIFKPWAMIYWCYDNMACIFRGILKNRKCRKYIIYYGVGLTVKINMVSTAIMLLASWVIYIGTHISKTRDAKKFFDYGTWGFVCLLIYALLWLVRATIVLFWEARAVYSQFSDRILNTGSKLYFFHKICDIMSDDIPSDAPAQDDQKDLTEQRCPAAPDSREIDGRLVQFQKGHLINPMSDNINHMTSFQQQWHTRKQGKSAFLEAGEADNEGQVKRSIRSRRGHVSDDINEDQRKFEQVPTRSMPRLEVSEINEEEDDDDDVHLTRSSRGQLNNMIPQPYDDTTHVICWQKRHNRSMPRLTAPEAETQTSTPVTEDEENVGNNLEHNKELKERAKKEKEKLKRQKTMASLVVQVAEQNGKNMSMYHVRQMAKFFLKKEEKLSKVNVSRLCDEWRQNGKDLKMEHLLKAIESVCDYQSNSAKHTDLCKRLKKAVVGNTQERDLEAWMVMTHKRSLQLARTLASAKEIVDVLNRLLTALIIVAVIIIWFLLTGIATTKLLVIIVSPVLAASFIFSDSAKVMFQGLMFAYTTHPFDVGDLCVISDTKMEVKRIRIRNTTFVKIYTGEEVTFPNSVLAEQAIVNLKNDFELYDYMEFSVEGPYPEASSVMASIEAMKKYILSSNDNRFDPDPEAYGHCIKAMGKHVHISIRFKHKRQEDMTYAEFLTCRNETRSDLLGEILKIVDELGLKDISHKRTLYEQYQETITTEEQQIYTINHLHFPE